MTSEGKTPSPNAVGRLLLEALRSPEHRREALDDLVAKASVAELEDMARWACYHRLGGVVYLHLKHIEAVPDAVRASLRDAYRQSAAQHLRVCGELAGLVELLGALNDSWLVVKGPVLAELCYRDIGLRQYGDLDIVVSGPSFGAVLEALEASGGRVLQSNWPVLRRKALGQVMARLPKGTTGDLHWHLVADSRARRRFGGPMEEFFSRSVPVELRGTAVATLSPTDQLVHLCLHAMLAGGHSLVWLKDIELSIANRPPDWDELVARALRYRLGLTCALLLEASGRVLGAEVPAGLTRELSSQGGRPLLWWQSLRRRYLPGERVWVRQKRTGQTLIGCTGLATTSTLGNYSLKLASEAWVQGRERLGGTWVAERVPFITITPPSLSDVSGDRTDRERYCQDVATWLSGGTSHLPLRHQGRGPTNA
jgi:hypothetical protein